MVWQLHFYLPVFICMGCWAVCCTAEILIFLQQLTFLFYLAYIFFFASQGMRSSANNYHWVTIQWHASQLWCLYTENCLIQRYHICIHFKNGMVIKNISSQKTKHTPTHTHTGTLTPVFFLVDVLDVLFSRCLHRYFSAHFFQTRGRGGSYWGYLLKYMPTHRRHQKKLQLCFVLRVTKTSPKSDPHGGCLPV